MKVVKCLVTSDQFIIELIIGGGGGKESVSVGDKDIENLNDLSANGEEVEFLVETRLIGHNKLEESNESGPEISPVVRYSHSASLLIGQYSVYTVQHQQVQLEW